ncbi:hypothetical protein DSO57_1034857 [Entomophthora muscae]|uniref:Uncharacterized protein n=1 Tax=Entomophthora muscae TaxID=34485 RepID=A0ACC2SP28_9FUNG|nr:hypothetical protein DSO57_1034857 [Entomophthora muscae]
MQFYFLLPLVTLSLGEYTDFEQVDEEMLIETPNEWKAIQETGRAADLDNRNLDEVEAIKSPEKLSPAALKGWLKLKPEEITKETPPVAKEPLRRRGKACQQKKALAKLISHHFQ